MTYPARAVNEAFAFLPTKMDSRQARIVHAAIGFQESEFKARRQFGNGPARGFWQFESGGGVKGVMTHAASKKYAQAICQARGVPFVQKDVWAALEHDDVLAAVFARLLMWADAAPLPQNERDAWLMYERTWRPGKPHPDKWEESYASAVEAVLP